MNNVHVPVLLNSVLSFVPEGAHAFFDGTFGGGGHAHALLSRFPDSALLGCDLDATALSMGQIAYQEYIDSLRLTLVHGRYDKVLSKQVDNQFDFILFDLGYSSNQLEYADGGFSYLEPDSVLDLRFDRTSGVPAYEWMATVNTLQLRDILYRYSGESLSSVFATAISKEVAHRPQALRTVGQLVSILEPGIPKRLYHKKNAIFSRVWQALRIYTNREYEALELGIEQAVRCLTVGGRLAIIGFQSLDDKIVTKTFRSLATPQVIDLYGSTIQYFKFLTKHAVEADDTEIESNRRARSARLRVLQKC